MRMRKKELERLLEKAVAEALGVELDRPEGPSATSSARRQRPDKRTPAREQVAA